MLNERYKNDGKPLLKLNAVQQQKKALVEEHIKEGRYEFEKVRCVICDSDSFEPLAEKDRYGLYMPTVICRGCGLVQINPRMTQESYNHFYDTCYRSLYTGSEMAGKSDLFHPKRGLHVCRFLERFMNFEGKKILEVGCGGGWNLNHFHKRGAVVKGIDLGEEYIEYGKEIYGLDLIQNSVFDLPSDEKYDLIIYSHVMEHILDPGQHLQKIRHLLSDGGLIYIEVPGVRNLTFNYQADFLKYLQNAHVYSLSSVTLKNLMEKYGFECVSLSEKVQSLWRPGSVSPTNMTNDFFESLDYLIRLEQRANYRKMKSFMGSIVDIARRAKRAVWR